MSLIAATKINLRYGPEVDRKDHPLKDKICRAYKDGVGVSKIRELYGLNNDRLYQILTDEGIPLREDRNRKNVIGLLPIPKALIDLIPSIRFLPRFAQHELVAMHDQWKTADEITAKYEEFIAKFVQGGMKL